MRVILCLAWAALAVAAAACSGGSPSREPADAADARASARTVDRGTDGTRSVVLTFDTGVEAGHTPAIIETLRRAGVKAGFGVTGAWAERYPDLLRMLVADGHRIVNHSYSHRSFTGAATEKPPLTRDERAEELRRTEELISEIGGVSSRPYFRPPYGDVDDALREQLAAEGYDVVLMWTVDSEGWNRSPANEIAQRSLAAAAPGAIYLMHVEAASRDADALEDIIAGLIARGYRFATVDEVGSGE
jgi:peptidoglycan/xylan/chitin deacetylase (PgdA/CDA1 family)